MPALKRRELAQHLDDSTVTKGRKERTKLFVLDTNVLIHDPTCFYHFQEHDLYLPMGVLEELDNLKKGLTEVARNARQATRVINDIVSPPGLEIKNGAPLEELSHGAATGRLFLQTEPIKSDIDSILPKSKVDNQILGVVAHLREADSDRTIVLVSKDINMLIKARALDIPAQDYRNDLVMEDTDLLYSGMFELPEDFWETHGKGMESWVRDGHTFYRITGPLVQKMLVNQCVYQDSPKPFTAIVKEVKGKKATLRTIADHSNQKHSVWGISARNREQNAALNLLLDPNIVFVTLLGQAGTGKTLLTLAAGLEQVLEQNRFSEIIFTRVTVPVGEDIGFLPGTEEEKMTPWMGALDDNLDVLDTGDGKKHDDASTNDWGKGATKELMRSRIKVKSLNYMRGRTFLKKFLVIDEAQNLTQKQMKTLITRAGPGTKVVCLGNIAQIDTPYLTEGSSGLTHVVDRFKGWAHNGHITLAIGERSPLATHAAEVL
jgi:PhoH-like ATPase